MLTYQQCSRINHYVQGSSGCTRFLFLSRDRNNLSWIRIRKDETTKNNEQDHLNILEKACFENSNALTNKRSNW